MSPHSSIMMAEGNGKLASQSVAFCCLHWAASPQAALISTTRRRRYRLCDVGNECRPTMVRGLVGLVDRHRNVTRTGRCGAARLTSRPGISCSGGFQTCWQVVGLVVCGCYCRVGTRADRRLGHNHAGCHPSHLHVRTIPVRVVRERSVWDMMHSALIAADCGFVYCLNREYTESW